ncbi:MAG TPA: hypothetical protein VF179_07565 [Thermoanaerobaculia bacterium]|nr:hypothetical protein [Thermoanaerobaculia bacterium]
MKSMQFGCLGILLALSLSQSVGAEPPQILEPQVERHQGPPLWLSAEAVAHSEKVIDLDLLDSLILRKNVEKQGRTFAPGARFEMSKQGEKPPVSDIPYSECKSMLAVEDDRGGEAPSSTLSDLANHSRSILLGTIKSIERGFSSGVPSSLLEVEVIDSIKGSAPTALIYIDYLVAHFRIGPYYFCNANKGYEPSPGDQVLLFDYTGPADQDGILYGPRFEQLVFQSRDGSLFLHPRLKSDPSLADAKNLSQVVTRARSAMVHRRNG